MPVPERTRSYRPVAYLDAINFLRSTIATRIGAPQGEGLLTPNQASVAFGDWTEPRHEAFAERNMWGLYNAITEGLKKGAPARTIERHANAHSFMVGMCSTDRPSRPSVASN